METKVNSVAKAHFYHLRISPRKVGIVLDLIRRKPVELALGILKHTPKSASPYLYKLVQSAAANAVNGCNMSFGDLYISECFASPGPTLRRTRPVSKGRGHRILKRSSHVTIVVKEKEKEDDYGSKDKS